MNIWLLQIGETLPLKDGIRKLRTAIISEKFAQKGHSVLWWASSFDHFTKSWVFKEDTEVSIDPNIKIRCLKGRGYRRNISFSRFLDHRIIARKFRGEAPKLNKPDIIIAATPSYDLAFEAVSYAKREDIPIVVDIRDQWPDIFMNHIPPVLKGCLKMLLRKEFSMIRAVMQDADGLVAMMDSLLSWGLKYAERKIGKDDKVFYLGCEKVAGFSNGLNKIKPLLNKLRNKFIVVFVGTFGYYHNPRILIECARRLTGTNIYFVLAGNGKFFKEIKREAAGLSNMLLPGWLDQHEITSLLNFSHVGVCPTTRIVDFFPNKAFAYLSAGLPVISAFEGDLKEIIIKNDIGFYYKPNDVDSLTASIKRLYENRSLCDKISKNATRLFDEIFDADKIYEEYTNFIERIAKGYKARTGKADGNRSFKESIERD